MKCLRFDAKSGLRIFLDFVFSGGGVDGGAHGARPYSKVSSRASYLLVNVTDAGAPASSLRVTPSIVRSP